MTLLLDTHFVIWIVNDPTMMSQAERRAMTQEGPLHVSAASLWELRIKWQTRDRHGRRKGVLDPADALRFCETQRWPIIPLEAIDSIRQLTPPIGHRDPFDEMLLVHAQRLGARLLTRDRQLAGHPLALQL